jgi:hypothetical protein
MTRIEDLLRQALDDTPITSTATDPLAGVERRLHRARRRLAVGAGVTAAVVAAAIVVPLVSLGDSHRTSRVIGPSTSSPTPTPTASPVPGTFATWPVHGVGSVTQLTDGSVWSALTVMGRNRERWYVIQQDGTDGHELQRIELPSPINTVVGHESTVWAFGGGDGGYPDGDIFAISPNGHVATHHFIGNGVRGIAFSDADTWVTVSPTNSVALLRGNGDRIDVVLTVPLTSQPRDIVNTGDGTLWVLEDIRQKVVQIVTQSGAPHVGKSFAWSYPLFGATGSGALLTTEGSRVVQINPETMAAGLDSTAYGYRIDTPGDPSLAVEDGAGGLYVAVSRHGAGTKSGIAYYADTAAADSTGAEPTAFRPMRGYIASIIPAPTGGVLIASGGEWVWDPNG